MTVGNYDTSKDEGDLQRYFIYKTVEKNGQKLLKGECRKCGNDYSRIDSNTSSMINHLEKCDNAAWKIYKSLRTTKKEANKSDMSSNQFSINSAFKAASKWKDTDPRSIAEDIKILKWMCGNLMTLSATDAFGFGEMLPENYRSKGRTFMTKLMEEQYAVEFKLLQERLKPIQHIAFTSDLWSSKNASKSFLSLTTHYIDSNFERHFEVLFCKPIDCAHTGQNIANLITDALDEAKIPVEKRHMLIRDAAANMKSATKLAKLPSIDCFVHKLQLCVRDALAPFEDKIKQARKIPSLYNRSNKFRKSFKDMAVQMGLKPKALIQDIKTRWDSELAMLKSLIEYRAVIGALSTESYDAFDEEYKEFGTYKLPALDFDELQQLVDALEIFAEYTKQLSYRDASICEILPIYYHIKQMIKDEDEELDTVTKVQSTCAKKLVHRMTGMERDLNLLIATALDPRIKDRLFSDEQKVIREQLIVELKSLVEHQSSPAVKEVQNEEPLLKKPKMSTGAGAIMSMLSSKKKKGEDMGDLMLLAEIDSYFNEDLIDYSEDRNCILKYWKNSNLPGLKEIARKYLCPPPTSVDSERMFSGLGNIYTDDRNRLSSEHAEMQLFLYYTYKK